MAPPKALKGNKTLLSGPTSILIIWGIINPTKPIIPLTDTQAAMIIEEIIIRIFFSISTSIPKLLAVSSPVSITFKSFE